jgi:hypothetical protein
MRYRMLNEIPSTLGRTCAYDFACDPLMGDDPLLIERTAEWAGYPFVIEVIVVTATERSCIESCGPVRVLHSDQPNRGQQMNLGEVFASGEILLFHHADSELTAQHLELLKDRHSDPTIMGGALYREFDDRHPSLRWLKRVERWRNRHFGSFYGDQSILV